MYNNKLISRILRDNESKAPCNNMKCFYHHDNDGKLAAYFVYLYTNCTNENNYIEVDYINSMPSADMVNEGDIVYIVDCSFTPTTGKALKEIVKKAKLVYWYDHHKSSKELFNFYDDYSDMIFSGKLKYNLEIDKCGALITFNNLFPDMEIPTILTLVDDYDRFVLKYPESRLLKLATDGLSPEQQKDWSLIELDLNKLIEYGKIINDYDLNVNSKDFENNGYTCTINGTKCFVMNKPGNSAVFGKYYNTENVFIEWCYVQNKYKYSAYSKNPNIDCSKIANYFNPTGGGHKGAAGWTLDKLCILPNDEFKIPM